MKTQIFFFSIAHGETKTPKIIGCCRASFAFLPALKIGTFRRWKMNIGVTVQNLTFRPPGSSFFESMVKLFFLCMFFNDAKQKMLKMVG